MSFKISLKKAMKSPIIIIPFSIFFVALAFLLYRCCFKVIGIGSMNTEGILGSISFSASYLKYVFIFFLFISYEACKDVNKDSISENLHSYKNSQIKLYFSHLMFLSFFAFITFILFYLFNLISYQNLSSGFNIMSPEYKTYILKFSFLYAFVLPLSAICMGVLSSALFKRIGAYIAMLIIVMLTLTTQIEGIAGIFAIVLGEKVYSFVDLFNIFPDGLDRRSFFWSSFSVGEPKYIRLLVIITISITLLVIFVQKKKYNLKNTVLKLACVTLCALILFEYITPKSQLILTDDHPKSSTISEVLNHGNNENEAADYIVKSYQMDLEIKNSLSAIVKIVIDKTDKEELNFTLWNSFNLKAVKDGKSNFLQFTRDGNYVSVSNNKNNDTLIFEYNGFSHRFVTNSDFVYLPGYFPYYPIAGKCPITNPQNDFAFNDNSYEYDIQFDINVKSKYEIFSNIEKTDRNKFSGKAKSACVLAGFIDEVEIDDIKLIYPYTSYPTIFRSSIPNEKLLNDNNYLLIKDNIEKLKKLKIVNNGDIIVYVPNLGQQDGERYMMTNDVVYVLNIIGFSEDSDEEVLDYFKTQTEAFYHD